MPDHVRITDVAPRDGLQNEPGHIPAADKARLVELLAAAGVDEIEVSSFVSPKWIPQLGDADEVFSQISDLKSQISNPESEPPTSESNKPHTYEPPAQAGRDESHPPLTFSALVPNEQGMRAALAVNERAGFRLIDKVAVFTAASETFSQRNTNGSIEQTIRRFEPVIALAHEHDLDVRGYISCIVTCPFEGPIDPRAAAAVVNQLVEVGVDELDLGDTIGRATPETITAAINEVLAVVGKDWLDPLSFTLHLHDTFGRAAECVRAAIDLGVRSFDGSVAGLGGCPYASTPQRRAPGNIATETLVRTIHEAGYETNVDLARLAEAAEFAAHIAECARAEGT